jgi:photosystem II stability/assembly factor-like uncharacterized protein
MQAIGTGVLANAFECVSQRTCFAVVYPQPGDALHDGLTFPGVLVAKTENGGATWIRVRSLPSRWSPQPVMSCPTVEMCALAAQPTAPHDYSLPAHAIAITQDGGSSWTVHHLSLPGVTEATVQRITCTDGRHCVVYVAEQGSSPSPGVFISTDDGGATWTPIGTVPLPVSDRIVSLRCAPGGHCIALALGSSGGITLTSGDFGARWTQGAASPFRSSAIMNSSCGDALHCVYSTGGGGLAFTRNGGQNWEQAAVPVPDGQTVTAVDCANGMDCSVAAAQWNGRNYANPVVYRTEDGGLRWRSLEVPTRVDGWFVSTVTPLSCPSNGCIGVAQTRSPSSRPTKRLMISSF